MISRRFALLSLLPASAAAAPAEPPRAPTAAERKSFDAFVQGIRADAQRAGIQPHTLDLAFKGIGPNMRVVQLDRRQPEFTITWDQYKVRATNETRIAKGRELFAKNKALLEQIAARYGVPAAPLMGIWGLESDYGASTGGFHVIEALATLAWEGRRAAFFRGELMDALKIIQAGDITAERMTGSYAGAMGQPQFMPDSYLKFAVDFSGDGKRDIWTSVPDILASIANYLAKSGWDAKLPWGTTARLPPNFDPTLAGRDNRRTVEAWEKLGVTAGRALPAATMAAVILPGGAGGEAFLACHPNFQAIRRYNPSDFYALVVGLLGERASA